jgi:hypothetical protein
MFKVEWDNPTEDFFRATIKPFKGYGGIEVWKRKGGDIEIYWKTIGFASPKMATRFAKALDFATQLAERVKDKLYRYEINYTHNGGEFVDDCIANDITQVRDLISSEMVEAKVIRSIVRKERVA